MIQISMFIETHKYSFKEPYVAREPQVGHPWIIEFPRELCCVSQKVKRKKSEKLIRDFEEDMRVNEIWG